MRLRSRIITMMFAGLLVATMAPAASATTFTMSSAEIELRGIDPGLVFYSSLVNGALPWTFTLDNVGDSVSRNIFNIGTDEVAVNLGEDTESYDASASFAFSSPPGTSSNASGSSTGIWLFFLGLASVDWTTPALIDFGAAGALSISLADLSFVIPGSKEDRVTVTLERAAVAVPVPATVLLVGLGLASVLGGQLLRKRRQD